MTLSIIVIGGGGHAMVLLEALRMSGSCIEGIVDTDVAAAARRNPGYRILGNDDVIRSYAQGQVQLVNGVGAVGRSVARKEIFDRFKSWGFDFAIVVHPSAVVAKDVVLGEGAQIMAGAILQPGVRIGVNAIVNTGASVDHECFIGDHVHIAPGATLSGNVAIGDCGFVGAGATILQEVHIGRGSIVAAGATVIDHVHDETTVAGTPARLLS